MIAASLVDTNVLVCCYLRSDGVLTSISRIGLGGKCEMLLMRNNPNTAVYTAFVDLLR